MCRKILLVLCLLPISLKTSAVYNNVGSLHRVARCLSCGDPDSPPPPFGPPPPPYGPPPPPFHHHEWAGSARYYGPDGRQYGQQAFSGANVGSGSGQAQGSGTGGSQAYSGAIASAGQGQSSLSQAQAISLASASANDQQKSLGGQDLQQNNAYNSGYNLKNNVRDGGFRGIGNAQEVQSLNEGRYQSGAASSSNTQAQKNLNDGFYSVGHGQESLSLDNVKNENVNHNSGSNYRSSASSSAQSQFGSPEHNGNQFNDGSQDYANSKSNEASLQRNEHFEDFGQIKDIGSNAGYTSSAQSSASSANSFPQGQQKQLQPKVGLDYGQIKESGSNSGYYSGAQSSASSANSFPQGQQKQLQPKVGLDYGQIKESGSNSGYYSGAQSSASSANSFPQGQQKQLQPKVGLDYGQIKESGSNSGYYSGAQSSALSAKSFPHGQQNQFHSGTGNSNSASQNSDWGQIQEHKDFNEDDQSKSHFENQDKTKQQSGSYANAGALAGSYSAGDIQQNLGSSSQSEKRGDLGGVLSQAKSALQLANEQAQLDQSGCSTCGGNKHNLALSNSKSTNGDAVSVSVSG